MKEIKPKTKEDIEQLEQIYKQTFLTVDGMKMLNDLAKRFGFVNCNYRDDFKPEQLIFREGGRNVILYILNKIGKTSEDILKI